MATIKEINHDSSTTLSNHYTTSISDPDGAVTVTIGAALNSSTNGVNMDFDAGSNIPSLVEAFTLTSDDFRWRIRIKLDNMSSAGVAALVIDAFLETGGGADVFKILVSSLTGTDNYVVEFLYKNDVGGLNSMGTAVSIPNTGEVCIEFRAIRESTSSSADGEVEAFVDGVSKFSISNAENNTFFAAIAQIIIRFGNDANLTGDMFYDEWLLDDDNTTALCPSSFSGYSLVIGGGQP